MIFRTTYRVYGACGPSTTYVTTWFEDPSYDDHERLRHLINTTLSGASRMEVETVIRDDLAEDV